MNPSASGWITKLLKKGALIEKLNALSTDSFYNNLRASGFIYGNNVFVFDNYIKNVGLTNEEICKINLIIAFYYIHTTETSKTNFIESVIDFYTEINAHKTSFFSELLGKKKNASTLEKIIHKRIQLDNNIIEKSFNYFITNALMFTDVLAYKTFLKTCSISETYIRNIEDSIETIVIKTLHSKTTKSDYDSSLIDLFEQSRRYHNTKKISYNKALKHLNTKLESYYIIDIACMAAWSDLQLDKIEAEFLTQLETDLKLDKQVLLNATNSIDLFYTNHKDKITLLGSKNIVKTFYNNSSKMVSKLISRNSKRLLKELHESKEVVMLISQSTIRNLNDEEQKKLNDQLLDVFKTIPSLAIFLLPGGALLLPLVIKFIPKLLPSAFDDNRVED